VCQNQQRDISGVAPGGLLVPPGDSNNMGKFCTAWRLVARECSARWCWENSGAGRALAPGGGQVPLGGLDLYRLTVLGVALSDCAVGYDLCVLLLIDNDAMLGSGDDVP